jgi:hypothetical protein
VRLLHVESARYSRIASGSLMSALRATSLSAPILEIIVSLLLPLLRWSSRKLVISSGVWAGSANM